MLVNSESYYQLLQSVTPCGSQTLSKMPNRYIDGVYPKVLEWGTNGLVNDVDGNSYIDLISGLGAISVGYAHPDINDRVISQLIRGVSFSLPTVLEYKLALKLVKAVSWTEMWKFGKTGTEGTTMAVRAARAYTGRTKIMTVGYNGCQEMFECRGVRTAGIPEVLKDHNTRAIYNDIDSFEDLNSREYACVLMEPMVNEYPKTGFLEAVKLFCQATGTVLIFDEVVTGGRFEGFTASSYFQVQPDLIVLSKGLANGFPICAVGGKRSFMATFERDDFFASGTFGGETVSMAAALETISILQKAIPKMVWKGRQIQEAFNKLDWEAECVGYPTRLDFRFPTKAHKALFWQEMCLQGVLIGYNNFIMATHTSSDINKIIDAILFSYKTLKQNWTNPVAALKGPLPTEALKKS